MHIVAEGGFEKATTKELTYYSGNVLKVKMNEVYIYRLFGSKEKLFEAVFLRLNNKFLSSFYNCFRSIESDDHDVNKKLIHLFLSSWHFIMENEEPCRYYAKYYYSGYFRGQSKDTHNIILSKIASKMASFFKEGTDLEFVLHSAFCVLLDFGIRVHNKELEDSEMQRQKIFNLLYCMVAPYIKP